MYTRNEQRNDHAAMSVDRLMRAALMAAAVGTLMVSAAAFGSQTIKERVGYAYAAGSDALLYTEHHQEWWDGGRILRDTVTYRDPEGDIIGEKHVDFRSQEQAPEFLLRNVRTGHSERAERVASTLAVKFRESRQAPLKSDALGLPEGAIIDAGFDRFVENNWDALMGGEVFIRPFLLPSRLQFVDFRIRRVDNDSDPNRAVFELAVDSALLRLFAPAITVAYDRKTRALLEYDGVSNMRDSSGKNLDVEIRFDGQRRELTSAARTPNSGREIN